MRDQFRFGRTPRARWLWVLGLWLALVAQFVLSVYPFAKALV